MPFLGAAYLVHLWANKDGRTVYPIGVDGTDAPGRVASLGIGFYLGRGRPRPGGGRNNTLMGRNQSASQG